MIILRNIYKERSFSEYGLGPQTSLKEDSERFDREIKRDRKWIRAENTLVTGIGSATIGAIGGGLAGSTKGRGKKGAAIGAAAASLAGLGARKLYRKVNNSKEKEDNEDNEVSQKFSKMRSPYDRFNVGLGLKYQPDGHKAYKRVVDRIIRERENRKKDDDNIKK